MSTRPLTYAQIIQDEKALLRDLVPHPDNGLSQELIELMVISANESVFETNHGYYPSDNKRGKDLPDDDSLADYVREATPFDCFEYKSIKINIVVEDTYLKNVGYATNCITGCIVNLPPETIVVNSFSKDHKNSAEFKSLLCHEAGHLLAGHLSSRPPIADFSNIRQELQDELNFSEKPDDYLFFLYQATSALNGGYKRKEKEANIIGYMLYHELNFEKEFNCDFLTAQERVNSHQSISTITRMMTKNMMDKLREFKPSQIIEKAKKLERYSRGGMIPNSKE